MKQAVVVAVAAAAAGATWVAAAHAGPAAGQPGSRVATIHLFPPLGAGMDDSVAVEGEAEAALLLSALTSPTALLHLQGPIAAGAAGTEARQPFHLLDHPAVDGAKRFHPFRRPYNLVVYVEQQQQQQQSSPSEGDAPFLAPLAVPPAAFACAWSPVTRTAFLSAAAVGSSTASASNNGTISTEGGLWVERGVPEPIADALARAQVPERAPEGVEEVSSMQESLALVEEMLTSESRASTNTLPPLVVVKLHAASGSPGAADVQAQVLRVVEAFVRQTQGHAMVLVAPRLATSLPALRVQLAKRAAAASSSSSLTTAKCPKTEGECQSTFNNCSLHGACAMVPLSPAGANCYLCKCHTSATDDAGNKLPGQASVLWTGPTCQAQDVSVHFAILLALTIGLAVVTLSITGLMGSIAEEGAYLQGSFGGSAGKLD